MDYVLLSKLYYRDKQLYEDTYRRRIACDECVYRLPLSIGPAYPAFFMVSKEVAKLMQDIYLRNNKLSRLYNRLPTVAQKACLAKSMVDEILSSNDIEGVYSTRKELHIVMNAKRKSKKRLQGLVNKYNMILQKEEIPLATCEDVRNLYNEMLLEEIDSKARPDGAVFRKDSVSVYSPTDKEIHQGVNPESQLIACMTESLHFLHDESIPQILRIAAFHYLFGYMHPFYDGNGRLSRFISSYLLKDTLNFLVSFRISYIINNNKHAYYQAFKNCNDIKNRGDITPFVISFLTVIFQAVESLIAQLDEMIGKLTHYKRMIKALKDDVYRQIGNSDKRLLNFQDNIYQVLFIIVQNTLFSDTAISIDRLASGAKLSVTWTRACVQELTGKGYVTAEKSGHALLYSANLELLDSVAEAMQKTP